MENVNNWNFDVQCCDAIWSRGFFPAADYLRRRQIRILGPRVRDPGLEIPHRALITRENALVELTLEFHANNLSEGRQIPAMWSRRLGFHMIRPGRLSLSEIKDQMPGDTPVEIMEFVYEAVPCTSSHTQCHAVLRKQFSSSFRVLIASASRRDVAEVKTGCILI